MRNLLTAAAFAALALTGLGMGLAQGNTQVAEVKYDYPTNADESDVNIRDVAGLDIRHDYPRPELDGDQDHRPAPNGVKA